MRIARFHRAWPIVPVVIAALAALLVAWAGTHDPDAARGAMRPVAMSVPF